MIQILSSPFCGQLIEWVVDNGLNSLRDDACNFSALRGRRPRPPAEAAAKPPPTERAA